LKCSITLPLIEEINERTMSDKSSAKRICVIKTSSLGDVIHTLPAITDARNSNPDYVFDWVVEENFSDIPALHPGVANVIPIALRRWRRSPLRSLLGSEFKSFRRELGKNTYDLVIDAQGLLKSAMICSLIPGHVVGLDSASIREPLASWFYSEKYSIPRYQHAVERIRQLFALALGYPNPGGEIQYGINLQHLRTGQEVKCGKQILFLHGTTWPSKHWPEEYWRELAVLIDTTEYDVVIPWGTELERLRAERIAHQLDSVSVLPELGLASLMRVMSQATGAISVDTGLCHLSAAMEIPTLAFYGPTDPTLTGNYGSNQIQIVNEELPCIPCLNRDCRLLPKEGNFPPCFRGDSVEDLWQRLVILMRQSNKGE
jgi:heptosyltransferase-1